ENVREDEQDRDRQESRDLCVRLQRPQLCAGVRAPPPSAAGADRGGGAPLSHVSQNSSATMLASDSRPIYITAGRLNDPSVVNQVRLGLRMGHGTTIPSLIFGQTSPPGDRRSINGEWTMTIDRSLIQEFARNSAGHLSS